MAYEGSALRALSDDTRRAVFELIAERPRTVGQIAEIVPVTRPAVSQHVAVLRDAGLVKAEIKGTQRVYHIDPAGLGPLRAWLDRFWTDALEQFRKQFTKEDPKK